MSERTVSGAVRAAPVDWDAATYDRVSTPMQAWGREVLDRLPLRGDETVLDAGCGSGRVTMELLARLPNGRVVAVDAAPAMVSLARETLPSDRTEVIQCDLVKLELAEPVDAVLSTATFHWIADHERLFARLHAALRPSGGLVAQCGGEGNIARFHATINGVCSRNPFAAHFAGWKGPWNYASPADTERRLVAAGFEHVRCWLVDWPVVPPDPSAYIRAFCLRAHLDLLPEPLREPFVEAVIAAEADPLEIDYVRLNIDARRAA